MPKGNTIASSFAFKFVERLAVKGIGVVISVLLARMIAPEIFGSLAIVNVFINLAITFVNSGLGTALIQNKSVDDTDYSTVFYISLAIAVALVGILIVTAPNIAAYYNDPLLVAPLRVFSLSLIIGSFNSVQTAKMQREMQFKLIMYCNLASTVVSGVIGVVSAYLGLGLWALIIYNFTHTIFTTLFMFIAGKWCPRLVFSIERAKVLFEFGWRMLVSALITSLYNDIRSLIIGKKYSKMDLAYYNRGQQLPQILALTMDSSVQAVMLPVMAKKQDDKKRIGEILCSAVELSSFVVAPVMMGMFAVAGTLIPILLTDKWNSCIPLLEVFCFGYLVLPIITSNLSVIKALGRSDVYMKLESIRRIIMCVILLISIFCFHDVFAIVVGFAITEWIDSVVICQATRRLLGIGWFQQIKRTWKTLLSSVIMGLIAYVMNSLEVPLILRLCLQVVTGVAIYILLAVLMKNASWKYIFNTLNQMIMEKVK